MFNNQSILECYNKLVGWRESVKAPVCYNSLTNDLKTSDSGLFINDISGVDLNLINDCIGVDNASVNTYLKNIQDNEILNLCNLLVNKNKEQLNTKSLLSNFAVGVKNSLNIRNVISKRNRFVGFEIKPFESNSIRVQLTELGVQLDTLGSLDIYFYSASQLQPIATQTITTTKQSSTEWFKLVDLIAEYISKDKSAGDKYYIGYYEDDLTGNAVDTELMCSSCNGSAFKEYSKYMNLVPIQVEAGSTYVSRELFDTDNVNYTNKTYGLHLKVNATCDITNVLCENKLLMSNLLQKRIAIKVLWDAFNSDRINRVAFINKDDSRLMADKLEFEFANELKNISLDFSNIDAVCLPCKRKSIGVMQLWT